MNPHSTRISLDDTFLSTATKMSEGNPGALTVLIQLMKNADSLDPDSALGGFGSILNLDSMGIYGSHIWILYKYVCGENLRNMIGILRGHQLGFIGDKEVSKAIASVKKHERPTLDVLSVIAQVEKRLPNFKAANVQEN